MKPKFKVGDYVTYTNKCPKDMRFFFARGRRKIEYIGGGPGPYPYQIGRIPWGLFAEKELKLAKKKGK